MSEREDSETPAAPPLDEVDAEVAAESTPLAEAATKICEPAPSWASVSRQAPAPRCARCGHVLRSDAQFCGGCGQEIASFSDGGALRMTLSFYAAALLLFAAGAIYTRISDNLFIASVGATLAFAALAIGYAARHRDLIRGPSRIAGFAPRGYALIVIASVPILLVIVGYVALLHHAFALQPQDELHAFAGRHFLWPLLMVAVLPPLCEELAFRGLIFGGLRRTLTAAEALLVSSFAFAILHLSVPSLVTHLPLGLYLGWLRHRSGSLWPGVFAHLCHNLGVCILTWCGLS